MEQKNTLLQVLQKSKEFQEYIQKNQSKLNNLKKEGKKYWTPEIMNLQQEVIDMSKEVYGAPIMK